MKVTVSHILEFLEEWAPQSTKLEYDNTGLLVGNDSQQVRKAITCLDVTPEVVEEAISEKADLIIAHHPLIFRKLSRITSSDTTGSLIYRLVRNHISLIAAHTNLDAAPGGVSFVMAERLGLQNLRFLKEGQYEDGGETGGLQKRDDKPTPDHLSGNTPVSGFGVIGALPGPMPAFDFLSLVGEKLDSKGIRYSGSPQQVLNVAVCGGAGAFLRDEAISRGADTFVTADLKYHDFFTDAPSFMLVDAGHYETEVPVTATLCDRVQAHFPGIEVSSTKVNTNPVTYFDNP